MKVELQIVFKKYPITAAGKLIGLIFISCSVPSLPGGEYLGVGLSVVW
ncbi:MAG: hypothetical protein LBV77_03600 [Candidatus Adiutrix intracellularis]|nr:hypothetical protein [Candidatus Adiutrix intracellularis]